MSYSKSLESSTRVWQMASKIAVAVLALSLSAQIKFYLPISPVPISAQTFAVALTALLLGRNLATISLASYLALGFAGLPIFSGLKAASLGPSAGYLFGMLAAAYVVGSLRDKTKSLRFPVALAMCYVGSLVIFSFGAFGLSFYVARESVFSMGVAPFLLGDLLKNILAAGIATRWAK